MIGARRERDRNAPGMLERDEIHNTGEAEGEGELQESKNRRSTRERDKEDMGPKRRQSEKDRE